MASHVSAPRSHPTHPSFRDRRAPSVIPPPIKWHSRDPNGGFIINVQITPNAEYSVRLNRTDKFVLCQQRSCSPAQNSAFTFNWVLNKVKQIKLTKERREVASKFLVPATRNASRPHRVESSSSSSSELHCIQDKRPGIRCRVHRNNRKRQIHR